MARTILIADDHPLFRAALRGAIAPAMPDVSFVEADTVAHMLDAVERVAAADVLLLDLDMPGAHGFSALAHVRGLRPELPVIIVSATDDPHTVASAFSYGAQGFIAKSADAADIGAGVEAVLQGEAVAPRGYHAPSSATHATPDLEAAARLAELTPQQFRVFSLMLSGLLNKQIAFELGVSEATIKAHVTAVLRKLGVSSRTQAVLRIGRLTIDHDAMHASPDED